MQSVHAEGWSLVTPKALASRPSACRQVLALGGTRAYQQVLIARHSDLDDDPPLGSAEACAEKGEAGGPGHVLANAVRHCRHEMTLDFGFDEP